MTTKKYRNKEERLNILSQFKKSGLSQIAFCNESGMNLSTLKSWMYKKGEVKKRQDKEIMLSEVVVTQEQRPSMIQVGLSNDTNISLSFNRSEDIYYFAKGLSSC